MRVRDLRHRLESAGCRVRRRSDGSHEVWETPGGRMMVLVVNHLAGDVSPPVLKNVRRALRREGISL